MVQCVEKLTKLMRSLYQVYTRLIKLFADLFLIGTS